MFPFKFLTKVALGVTMIVGALLTAPIVNIASATAAGDYQRAKICKQLRRSGRLSWYSIASGIVNHGGGRSGYGGFVTKACHTNEASCRRWVKRVAHEIPNLDTLESAYCKRVR